MYPPFVNRVLKKFFDISNSSENLYVPGSPWAQGADSPYQGETARRAKRGRDAGPKGLRGFERCKFRSTATSCKTLVGAGLCSARQYELFFTEICGEPALFFVIDDRFYSVGTHIRVYLKTPNAPGQRTFSRCAAPFFLEIRQYSCEKMSCSAQKFLAAGHIGSFQIHPRNLQLPISIFFYFSKRKRWQKKTSPEGFRFPSGSS